MTIQARHSTPPASIRMRITMPPATLAPMTTLSVLTLSLFEFLNPSVGGMVGSEICHHKETIPSDSIVMVAIM